MLPKPGVEMSREELATNFHKHFKAELESYGHENKASLTETLNKYSPADPEKKQGDALLETIARKGLRTDVVGDTPASPIADFFASDDASWLLGVEYMQEAFHRNIGVGVQLGRFDKNGNVVELATSDRSGVSYPFNPSMHGMEVDRDYRPRVQLRHVIARRIPIVGSTYQPGIVESPDDTALRPTAEGADLPEYLLKTSDESVNTTKVGYGLRVTYELINNRNMTMDLIAESQRQKAAQVENAIVNRVCDLQGGTGATTIDFGASVTSLNQKQLLLRPDDMYYITTIIGTLDAIAAWKDVDPTYNSMNYGINPGVGRYLDEYGAIETVAKKTTAQVPALNVASHEVLIAWHRPSGVDWVTERRAMISEQDRNTSNQTILFTNSHRFALRQREEADQCRYKVEIG